MNELTRCGLAMVVWCGAAATAAPLTTCRDSVRWALEPGPNIPALGRVLRAHEKGTTFSLELSDGRVWAFSQQGDSVLVESGGVEALRCQGTLARQPLLALVQASRALPARKTVGLCKGEGFVAPVTIGAVLGGGAVEVRLSGDDERVWTLVLTSLIPTGTFVRCYASAGQHCEPTPAPKFEWEGRTRVSLSDSATRVTLDCNLEKEELARVLSAQGADALE